MLIEVSAEQSGRSFIEVDTVRDELEEFVGNVRNGTTPETGGPEALEAVAVLEGIVESAATGTVVDLDEVRARE